MIKVQPNRSKRESIQRTESGTVVPTREKQ